MSSSTLDPDQRPVEPSDRAESKRPGTELLGPSDLSDTGADTVGGPGVSGEDALNLDRGTTSDPGGRAHTAGPSLGDADLDSDTDSGGTGERAAAGTDPIEGVDRDIGFDRTVDETEAGLGGGLDQAEEAELGITDEEVQAKRERDSG
jgi:hypothetical protein